MNGSALFCSRAGSDTNDGSGWNAAKQTFLAAYDALPPSGGTINVADDTPLSGAAGQGLWIAGNADTQFNALPPGWRKEKSVHVVGTGATNGGFSRGPQVRLGWGSGGDLAKPALWLSGTSASMRFDDLHFQYPAVALRLGIDSSSPAPCLTHRDSSVANVVFNNCGNDLNQVNGSGPAVDIGYLFWVYFNYCSFAANRLGQPDATADNRAAVLVKPMQGGPSSNLLFFNHCLGKGGGIKYYTGGSSWTLAVDDFSTEDDTDSAVWLVATNPYGRATLKSIQMSDNPVVGATSVRVGGGPAEAVVCEDVNDVTGPAVVLNRYPAGWQSTNATPAASRQVGFWQGRVSAQHDSDRRAFGPVAVRFPNLADHDPTLWVNGNAVVTAGKIAPDGTTGAVQLSTVASGVQERQAFRGSIVVGSGDWFICGFWYRAQNGAVGSSYGNTIAWLRMGGGPNFAGGGSSVYVHVPLNGDGEWEWVTDLAQVNVGGTADTIFGLRCDSTHTNEFYAPVLLRIPAGALSQSEVYELTQHLHAWPKGAPVGSVSTYGPLQAPKGAGFWGHAAPASQPARPQTLADVIAILSGNGLSA